MCKSPDGPGHSSFSFVIFGVDSVMTAQEAEAAESLLFRYLLFRAEPIV